MTLRITLRAGRDYPETPRLKAARLALISAALFEDADIDARRIEHRAALADALSTPAVKETA